MKQRPKFTYLSFGAGVQSTTLLLMSDKGLFGCPRADVAIFADTQAEPAYVYEHMEAVRKLVTIPIQVVSGGNLEQDSVGTTFMRLPAFSGTGGIVRRQCTREYKIAPIQTWVKRHLGYVARQRVKHDVVSLIGISVDEITRAKPSPDKWITRLHPLIDADMRRTQCLKLLEEHGWPIPKKSACVFCPFHNDAQWRDLRDNHPLEFARAVELDRGIRNSTKAGRTHAEVFLHRSLKPLDQVEFKLPTALPLFDSFTEECEGVCGV